MTDIPSEVMKLEIGPDDVVVIRVTDPSVRLTHHQAEVIQHQCRALLGEDTKVAVLPYELSMSSERDHEQLSPKGQREARSLLTGTTTSTVTQVWACGHQVGSVNGDSLYASCPICFTQRKEGS